jgi:rhamnosyl/mannosyltransferase
VVLFVGRLRAYKGLPHLLEALVHVDANLALVGDGPERRRLQRLTRRLGLSDRVHFTGHLPDAALPAAYQAADLFVLPSHLPSEAFGLVMVEAMASGLPVVCTELGTGTSVVVRHGQTGLVVPPADPAALADALRHLLADDALRRRLGRAGLQRARDEFAADVYVQRTLDAYADVLR